MRRLLCRLLGHRRWERDGRYRPNGAWGFALMAELARNLGGSMRYEPRDERRIEAQQQHPFTRAWRCWRCGDWVWERPRREVSIVDLLELHNARAYSRMKSQLITDIFVGDRETKDFGGPDGMFARAAWDGYHREFNRTAESIIDRWPTVIRSDRA